MTGVDADQCGKRNELPVGRRLNVELIERIQLALQVRRHFENDVVGIVGEILRHVVLTERVIERVVDDLRQDSETGRRIAIDGDGDLRRGILRIGGDVGQLRQCLELGHQSRRPGVQLVQIGILQDVLELAAGDAAADGDVLCRLQEQFGARHLRELRPQPVDDLRGRRGAVVTQLQANDEAPGILRIAVARAEERAEVVDVGVLAQ